MTITSCEFGTHKFQILISLLLTSQYQRQTYVIFINTISSLKSMLITSDANTKDKKSGLTYTSL